MLVWDQFCREQFRQRVLRESSIERETEICWRRLLSVWNAQVFGTTHLNDFIGCAFEVLSDHLDKVDWICRDIWTSQGGSVTALFVREVLNREIADQIETHTSALNLKLKAVMRKKGFEGSRRPVLHHFENATKQLKHRVSSIYDGEIRDLNCPSGETARERADDWNLGARFGLTQEKRRSEESKTALHTSTSVRIRGSGKLRESPPLLNSGQRGQRTENNSTSMATVVGRNIDRLRKECGWSFDKLAEKTGIDKKSILSHVKKGVKPTPRILKEYAQAFTNGLRQKITVVDLEQ